jgi:single stranded DNA-binding protein
MRDTNMVFLTGTVSKDVESGSTNSGLSYANIPMATVKSGFNGKADQTTFHTVSCFGELADMASGLVVGNRLSVTGRIQTDSWGGENGTPKTYRQKVVASNVSKILGEASEGEKATAQGGKPPENFLRGESSPKAAFPFHDAERNVDWPKPGPDGCSFITTDKATITCAWLNPQNPVEGGSVYEMKPGDSDWNPIGSIQATAKTPF